MLRTVRPVALLLVALLVAGCGGGPTPTATPGPGPTPAAGPVSPTPTATPALTPTATPAPTPTATPIREPSLAVEDATVAPGETAALTVTAENVRAVELRPPEAARSTLRVTVGDAQATPSPAYVLPGEAPVWVWSGPTPRVALLVPVRASPDAAPGDYRVRVRASPTSGSSFGDDAVTVTATVRVAESSPTPTPTVRVAESSPTPTPTVRVAESSPTPTPAVRVAESSPTPTPTVRVVRPTSR